MSSSSELSPEMIEKAREAINRSNFWEFIDRTMTLELAVASAKYDGERAPNRLRKAAKEMLKVAYDPLMRRFVDSIGSSSKALEKLDELKAYRDSLVTKVANEFTEAEKIGNVGEYRRQRVARMIQAV
ncbi:hypothetical protein [Enterobacter sp. CP102]|uniref:hypothetical protein n=1 Tax=Enterobacter sp. CP102 TaxID=2976431 RepID=UPI002207C709|nr:hypothetical protein [Enterobacter sp. CP102]UWM66575.1 hypothetical protein N1249_23085 [Enterobacter sp. CP102]